MAKKTPANKQLKKQASHRKVWRIFRFKERYELRDDVKSCRLSGLLFYKGFVSDSSGDEATGYFQQLNMLNNGDGEKYHLMEGIYNRLVREAAKRSRAYRGYLLNADDKPLSTLDISRLLKINNKKMISYMKKFESVGLIEHVDMPEEFDLSVNEEPKKGKDKKDGDTKKRGSKGPKKGNSGRVGKNPEKSGNSGNFGKPLNKDNINGNDNGKGNSKATIGKTAADGSKKNNDNGLRQIKSDSAGKNKTLTTLAPTTNPDKPLKPQESDAGGSRIIPIRGTPPAAADYSNAGVVYGQKIYRALGYQLEFYRLEAVREITSFASTHDEVCRDLANLSPPAVDAVLLRGIREAKKISQRKSNRRKGAVWNTVMDKLVTARQREANINVT